jgi:hypothetical protein
LLAGLLDDEMEVQGGLFHGAILSTGAYVKHTDGGVMQSFPRVLKLNMKQLRRMGSTSMCVAALSYLTVEYPGEKRSQWSWLSCNGCLG